MAHTHILEPLSGVTFLNSFGPTNYPMNMSVDDNSNSLCISVQIMSQISASQVCAYMQQSLESLEICRVFFALRTQ